MRSPSARDRVTAARSFSEELFELESERLRVDHVSLAFEGPTLRPWDARGDCVRGVIEG
jgi:hypothetical protein